MNFRRKEFEAATATILGSALSDCNWVQRVATRESVQKMGAIAYYLWSMGLHESVRDVAPEFCDRL